MLKGLLSGLNSRTALLSIILVSNAFVWYYSADNILVDISKAFSVDSFAHLTVWTTDFAVLIAAAFFGAHISKRLGDKTRFLSAWMIAGILLPSASLFVNRNDLLSVTLLSFAFSLSLGIGLPACIGYFTAHTPVEQRGRLGGLTMLFTGITVAVIGTVGAGDILAQAAFLSVWRVVGLAAFIGLRPRPEKTSLEVKHSSYSAILKQRSFLLYFAPWIMFSIVNYMTTPVQNTIFTDPNFIATLKAAENVLVAVFAVVGGFLIDTVGRKRVAITGFVALGIAYAVLGMAPTLVVSWYFHTAVDGIAWGLLLVLFVTTVWGDLSYEANSDKYYAMGVFPFFVSRFLPLAIPDEIVANIAATTIFSFTAFFLFLAVLPLIYAPETLPEKVMKERELKTYLEKAQEIAAKVQMKEEKPRQEEAPEDKDDKSCVEFEVPQENAEEAEKLAEKYY
jgi:MFS family permease